MSDNVAKKYYENYEDGSYLAFYRKIHEEKILENGIIVILDNFDITVKMQIDNGWIVGVSTTLGSDNPIIDYKHHTDKGWIMGGNAKKYQKQREILYNVVKEHQVFNPVTEFYDFLKNN